MSVGFRTEQGGRVDRDRPLALQVRRAPLCRARRRHPRLRAAGERRASRRALVQISPPARHPGRRRGRAERAGRHPARRGAHRAQSARDTSGTLRGAAGGEPEPVARARRRSRRRQRPARAVVSGRVLLQDLHVAAEGLGAVLRAAHPGDGGPRPRPHAPRPRPLPEPLRPLRRAGGGRRAGRSRGGADGGGRRRARGLVRRAGGTWRLAPRRDRGDDRGQSGERVAGRDDRDTGAPPARDAAAAHHRLRLLRAQSDRAGGARHRPSGRPRPAPAARAALAGAREAGGAGGGCHRTAAGVPGERPARRDAGRRGTHLPQPLRRALRHPRGRRHRPRRRLRRGARPASRGCGIAAIADARAASRRCAAAGGARGRIAGPTLQHGHRHHRPPAGGRGSARAGAGRRRSDGAGDGALRPAADVGRVHAQRASVLPVPRQAALR